MNTKIDIPSIPLTLLFAYVLGFSFLAFFLSQEVFFYVWDKELYHNLALKSFDRLNDGFTAWFNFIHSTGHDEYNAIFTIPIAPFIKLFGDSRLVFMLTIYGLYLVPFAVVMGVFFQRIQENKLSHFSTEAFAITLLMSTSWAALLHGLPDIGAAFLLWSAVLLYLKYMDKTTLWPFLATGILLGLSFLFRRHFAYGILSFFLVATGHQLYVLYGNRTLRSLFRSASNMALMGISCISVIVLFSPEIIIRVLTTDFNTLYASYHVPLSSLCMFYIERFGIILWLLAITGYLLRFASHKLDIGAVFLTSMAVLWVVIWFWLVKQTNRQYALHALLPFVIIGLSYLCMAVRQKTILFYGLFAIITLNFIHATFDYPFAKTVDKTRLFSAPYRPLQRFDFTEVTRLVDYLRTHTQSTDTIVVAASSQVLNGPMLNSAEKIVYGQNDEKLRIAQLGFVDSRDSYKMIIDVLLTANYVILASPMQHHLPESEQDSVQVILDVWQKPLALSGDFKKLPETFTLSERNITKPNILKRPAGDVDVTIYKRIRPSSPVVGKELYDYFSNILENK